jgi:hypothetical protein
MEGPVLYILVIPLKLLAYTVTTVTYDHAFACKDRGFARHRTPLSRVTTLQLKTSFPFPTIAIPTSFPCSHEFHK